MLLCKPWWFTLAAIWLLWLLYEYIHITCSRVPLQNSKQHSAECKITWIPMWFNKSWSWILKHAKHTCTFIQKNRKCIMNMCALQVDYCLITWLPNNDPICLQLPGDLAHHTPNRIKQLKYCNYNEKRYIYVYYIYIYIYIYVCILYRLFGEENFGNWPLICQIHQYFLPPTFYAIIIMIVSSTEEFISGSTWI